VHWQATLPQRSIPIISSSSHLLPNLFHVPPSLNSMSRPWNDPEPQRHTKVRIKTFLLVVNVLKRVGAEFVFNKFAGGKVPPGLAFFCE
jgi:hypothetical protein